MSKLILSSILLIFNSLLLTSFAQDPLVIIIDWTEIGEVIFLEEEQIFQGEDFVIAFANTGGEIGNAASNSIDQILETASNSPGLIASAIAVAATQAIREPSNLNDEQAKVLETQVSQIVGNTIENLNGTYGNVSGTIGDAVMNSVVAFRDARDKGQDPGAAVGAVVGDLVMQLNNSADSIAETVEDAAEAGANNATGLSPEAQELAQDIADRVDLVVAINLVTAGDNVESIEKMVADSVNQGVSEGGNNTGAEIANSIDNILEAIQENSEEIANAIGNATDNSFIGWKDITHEEANAVKDMAREVVVSALRNSNVTEEIRQGVNSALSNGAVNVSDVVTSVSQEIGNQLESGDGNQQ